MSTSKLAGKIALVTGGSSGIGLATAKRFVSEGAYVFITGRRQAELDAAVKLIGSDVTGIRSDVSNLADLDRIYAAIKSAKGHLDILFANAGGGSLAPLGQITEEHFDKTFNTNVRGLLFTVQKALPLMPPGSSIVLNASTTSIKGTPAFSVYSATKAAVRSFARNWTLDLKERKIRVNAVSPGVVPTPGYDLMGLTKDTETTGHARMTESISYRLKDEEIPRYWDKAMDKIIEVNCRRIAHSKAGKASLIGEIVETQPAAK